MASLKSIWRAKRPAILAGILYRFSRLVTCTLRTTVEGFDKSENLGARIYCGWHGKSMIFGNQFRNRGFFVIISHSNDGEMQKRIFARLGFQIIRGSSGRGGERALVEAIRMLKKGGVLAITPDGPRGPSKKVQPGVMMMARKTGAPLIPVGISADWKILAPTWDSYLVPLPFSRTRLIFGEPLFVPANADDEQIKALTLEFEHRINALEIQAEGGLK